MASHNPVPAPEKYFVAFVIQGEDVFKITCDSIVHTCGNSGEAAFREWPSYAPLPPSTAHRHPQRTTRRIA